MASATQLVLRNNLLSYTNADALGSALFVNNASLLASFDSQTNWFSSTDGRGRHLAWNGSRVGIADWRILSRHDAASLDSAPPLFDAVGRVVSADLGVRAGTPVGLCAISRHAAAGGCGAGHRRLPGVSRLSR